MEKAYKEKLFFIIYKDDSKSFKHEILYRRNKKQIKEEVREKGFTPKAVFHEKDIKAVLAHEFYNADVTDKEVDYLLTHLADWEMSK